MLSITKERKRNMPIVSLQYILFWGIIFLLYYTLFKNRQWILLLVASTFFYALAGARLFVFIIITSISTYIAALYIEKQKDNRKCKIIVGFTLIINITILAILKYFNFFAGNINWLNQKLGVDFSLPAMKLFLPLGISFYTFQTIGYLIDVYRGKYKPEKNLAKYFLFVIYFPHIIQGPIAKFDLLGKQLFEKHELEYKNVKFGLQLMLWGFFKKILIADQLGLLVDNVFNNYQQYAGIQYIIATVAYAIQIYADFSGCMDIVSGVSQTFGIELSLNFKRPYFSKTIPEFWRRWHITLGDWFREYLFYSVQRSSFIIKLTKTTKNIFGKKLGREIPVYLALLVVWFTTGLWHGASWNYVIWGVYYGILIISSMIFAKPIKRFVKHLKINVECESFQLFRILRTFFLVCIGYVFFRAENLETVFYMLKSMVSTFNIEIFFNSQIFEMGLSARKLLLVSICIILLLVVSIAQEKMCLREKLEQQNFVFRWIIYWSGIVVTMLGFLMQNGGFGETVKFIYMQF